MMCARMSMTYTINCGRASDCHACRCGNLYVSRRKWAVLIARRAMEYEGTMTPAQLYWANLDPVIKEQRRAAMRAYTKQRTALMPKKPRISRLSSRISHRSAKQESLYQFVIDCKLKLGRCHDCLWECEQWNHVCFAFDHLDPVTKSFALSRAPKIAKMTERSLINEIAKCHLVCHNCHTLRTWVYRDHDYEGTVLDMPIMPSLLDCPEWDVA